MGDDRWVQDELATADFEDARLTRRCQLVAAALGAQGQGSIPVACQSWAEIKAAYRFFAHDEVTLARVVAPHQEATRRRIAGEDVVIVAQDTTELDFSSSRVASHLGPLSYANRVGWLMHLSLALTPDQVCLGVVDKKRMYVRSGRAVWKTSSQADAEYGEKKSPLG